MSKEKRENLSLVGVEARGDSLYQKVTHRDGRVEFVPISDRFEKSMTARFKGTETIPADWTEPETAPLDKKETRLVARERSKEECFKIVPQIDALLYKVLARTSGTESHHIRDRAFYTVLQELCRIMGAPHSEQIKHLKYSPKE